MRKFLIPSILGVTFKLKNLINYNLKDSVFTLLCWNCLLGNFKTNDRLVWPFLIFRIYNWIFEFRYISKKISSQFEWVKYWIVTITVLDSGHCGLNYHLYKIELSITDHCVALMWVVKFFWTTNVHHSLESGIFGVHMKYPKNILSREFPS